ncbi:MAG: M15 family metallopeptidase [Clostridia bacterium]|nr:M15 family metallopeptidase [Clostridia bacterium]
MNQLQERELKSQRMEELRRRRILERKREIARKKKRKKLIRKVLISMLLFFAATATIVLCVLLFDTIIKDASSRKTPVATQVEYTQQNSEDVVEEPIEKKEEQKIIVDDSIEYKDETKEERYASYKKQNPHFSDEEIIWRVNANLDKPKYEYDIPVSGYDDPYIIVNKYYKVPDGYHPPDLKSFDGQLLREETGNAYKKMREDALKQGLNIRVVSGYRSVEYQRGLYNRYLSNDSRENVDRYSARPGYSEHHTGMAMDIFGSQDGLRNFENTPEYPWVRDNCYKYGFIIRYLVETEDITGYESEPWHLRYVGTKVSTEMKEKNIKSFEEYHAKYLQ